MLPSEKSLRDMLEIIMEQQKILPFLIHQWLQIVKIDSRRSESKPNQSLSPKVSINKLRILYLRSPSSLECRASTKQITTNFNK